MSEIDPQPREKGEIIKSVIDKITGIKTLTITGLKDENDDSLPDIKLQYLECGHTNNLALKGNVSGKCPVKRKYPPRLKDEPSASGSACLPDAMRNPGAVGRSPGYRA